MTQTQPQQSQPAQPQGSGGPNQADPKDIEQNKIWAMLGYVGIGSIVVLVAKKDSPFAQWHAKQGLAIFIAFFIGMIPIIGWLLFFWAFICMILGIINAAQGKYWKAPLFGNIVHKQAK